MASDTPNSPTQGPPEELEGADPAGRSATGPDQPTQLSTIAALLRGLPSLSKGQFIPGSILSSYTPPALPRIPIADGQLASGWCRRFKDQFHEFVAECNERHSRHRILLSLPDGVSMLPVSIGYHNPRLLLVDGYISMGDDTIRARCMVDFCSVYILMHEHYDTDLPTQDVRVATDSEE